jgi:flagellin-like protein
MRIQRPPSAERGVSKVVGVILMVAITVLLAATVAVFAGGFDEQLSKPAPVEGFDDEYVSSGVGNTDYRPYVNITHVGDEHLDASRVYITDGDGNSIAWADVWTGGPTVEPIEHVHIDGFDSDSALNTICERGQIYRVTYHRQDGTSYTIAEITIESPPDLPSRAATDGDDDGIPDWCGS